MKTIQAILTAVLFFLLYSCNTGTNVPNLGLASLQGGNSAAVSSHAPTPGSNADRIAFIKPGETTTIFEVRGPGTINHIWLTFNEARPNWYDHEGSANPEELIIRIYWDGSDEPAVEAPIGDFFASGFGLRNEIRSIPVTVETGDGYNCFWTMPYFKSAKITVTDDGKKAARGFYYQVDYTNYKKLPSNTAYFCAQYRQEYPEKTGSDYLIADLEGKGQYVGTVMSMRSRSPYWFGEGDAKFYVNGDKEPTIWGTGTEDYFLSAWGFDECLYDYFGCTLMDGGEEDLGVRYCMYRWHIKDPVQFTTSLRFEIEHKGWMSPDETETGKPDGHVEREDDLSTVAFWYQKGQPKRFTTIPPYEQRVLPDLEKVIEGKDMIASVRHSPGKVELQKGYDWTGDGQILFTPSTDKAWLEADFNIEKEEYRGMFVRLMNANNCGIYVIYIDGKPLLRVPKTYDTNYMDPNKIENMRIFNLYSKNIQVPDFYESNSGGSQINTRKLEEEYYLGSATLKKGKHTIRFRQIGRDPYSMGNSLGFDSFRLMKRWNKKRPSLGTNSAKSTTASNKE